VKKALSQIRRSLMTIVAALDTIAKEAGAPRASVSAEAPRRTLSLSPARMRALKLQGAYMGALRSLGPRQKAKVKALRASKGMDAAMRLAKQLSRKR
jgi:hypothetical protein